MDAKALIMDGQIDAARTMLVDQVKKTPADDKARSLLFQVMLLCGEWDKASRQLEIAAVRPASPDMNRPVFQNLIQAEKERTAVARLEQRPAFFPETPEYGADFLQMRERLAQDDIDAASELLDRISGRQTDVHGTIGGQSFVGFKDTDTALAYFIEAIEYERYLWVPITSIRELVISPPRNLIDLIWTRGRITTWEGLTMGCFLPVRYPGSAESDDEQIRLGRLTDWKSLGGGFAKALGQHVYEVGDEDKSIFELGEVIFEPPEAL